MMSFVTCTLHQKLLIKSGRIKWAGRLARMGAMRNVYIIELYTSPSTV